jgi:23S rRNA pseudouridine2605 synthase
LPARVRQLRVVRARTGPRAVIEIVIREGRHRQVRKMCDAIAHPVERLVRTRIGPVTLKGLDPGDLRDLTGAELRALMGHERRR